MKHYYLVKIIVMYENFVGNYFLKRVTNTEIKQELNSLTEIGVVETNH